ncbi:MAG TPA: 50S ribosomal protein L35 [Candidatus Omnitrophota bacterium]|nr:50S ribosomal protein L35 [Candidatus Omnitrophota bacterium]
MGKAKLKTKKGVAKRFKFTKSGKIKYHPASKGHLLTNKKSSRIRRLRKARTLAGKQEKFVRKLLPHGAA